MHLIVFAFTFHNVEKVFVHTGTVNTIFRVKFHAYLKKKKKVYFFLND